MEFRRVLFRSKSAVLPDHGSILIGAALISLCSHVPLHHAETELLIGLGNEVVERHCPAHRRTSVIDAAETAIHQCGTAADAVSQIGRAPCRESVCQYV